MKKLQEQIADYLQMNRSAHTVKTYGEALKVYARLVGDTELTAETYATFLRKIAKLNPATQALYRSVVRNFYSEHSSVTVSEFKRAEKRWVKKQGQRIPKYDRAAIEKLIVYANTWTADVVALRDRAFVLTLVDTGLRISEACALRRGDIDRLEQRAVVIGKGDKQAVVRFSSRALAAIDDYLNARKDGSSGKPLASLPLFARHDKKAGKVLRPIASGGMWKTIKARAEGIGIDKDFRIHDLRHYFITMFLISTGNLEATRRVARHASATTTSRYAHIDSEVDELYDEVFNK